jgi:DNA polymerase (family X)
MDKFVAALILHEIGLLLEVHGENRFRARAFLNAARALEHAPTELSELVRSGEVQKLKGIGPATGSVLQDLVSTGSSAMHRELRARTAAGLIELLAIPGLGARRVHTLRKTLGIESIDELERAAQAGSLAELPGFGARTQGKVLEGIAFVRSTSGRRRQPEALAVAAWVAGFLGGLKGVERADVVGEARRRLETVDGIDIVTAATSPDEVVAAFLAMPGAVRGERTGAGVARARLADGLELRMHAVRPQAYVSELVVATGSESHVAGLGARALELKLRLDRRGLWQGRRRIALAGEEELYARLELAFVPPELREGDGEIEAAQAGLLPRLITYADLRGCLHCHTTWSDGKAGVAELAEAALGRGWRYLGISDHSQLASYAGGLKPDDLKRQGDEIDEWNAARGSELWLFKGVEADILADGRLDYADEKEDVLGRLDFVIGSIHSGFRSGGAQLTQRVLRALEDPRLTFLGHPTGRLLLSREGYPLDLQAVIDRAAERGVSIEINANPRRMELDWRYWRRARALGIRTAINPDAHSPAGLGDVRFGVNVARKGWLTTEDVVNAWELDEVRSFLARRRSAA